VKAVKALGKKGFYFKRQEGSHIVIRREDPSHKEPDRGTLRVIIRQAGLSVDEFVKLL